jgi:hypothetical protein
MQNHYVEGVDRGSGLIMASLGGEDILLLLLLSSLPSSAPGSLSFDWWRRKGGKSPWGF